MSAAISSPVVANTSATPATDKDAGTAGHVRTPSIPSVLLRKDNRDFERDRQRRKRAADISKLKHQSQNGRFERERINYHGHGLSLAKQKQLRPDELDRLDDVVDIGDVNGHWDDDILLYTPPTKEAPVVHLEELIASKTKNSKRKDSDFEVVPHLRSVIVLEDFSPDVAADEPWEYLSDENDSDTSGSGGSTSSTPTYAQVLSLDS